MFTLIWYGKRSCLAIPKKESREKHHRRWNQHLVYCMMHLNYQWLSHQLFFNVIFSSSILYAYTVLWVWNDIGSNIRLYHKSSIINSKRNFKKRAVVAFAEGSWMKTTSRPLKLMPRTSARINLAGLLAEGTEGRPRCCCETTFYLGLKKTLPWGRTPRKKG